MSKSKGNVINPDEYISKFGADSLRMYLMFLAPFEQGGDFRDEAILGIVRFLDRVWKNSEEKETTDGWKKTEIILQKTIEKITDDIEGLKYNTAISELMKFLRLLEDHPNRKAFEIFLKLLSPFAPHITEELWHQFGNKTSIHKEQWPEPDRKYLEEKTFDLIVQVNGKHRLTLSVMRGITKENAIKLVEQYEKVKLEISDRKPKKIVFVPDRLINFVV